MSASYKKIAEGGFLGRTDNSVWEVRLYRLLDEAPEVRRLTFDDQDPAELEWPEADKLAPLRGSALTLNIISDTNYEYVDLYAVRTADVRVELYFNGDLYWQGTLDPEQYEEPYVTDRGYEVSLTFSDLGAADRLEFAGSGMMTVADIVGACLTRCLGTSPEYAWAQNTTMGLTDARLPQDELCVNCANFYDEEGEPMTCREVMEAVIQPLGLCLVQTAGAWLWLDCAGLMAMAPEHLYQDGTDAVLGTDRIYNKVTLTLSQYADTESGRMSIDPDKVLRDCTNHYQYYIYGSNDTGSTSNRADGFEAVIDNPSSPDGRGVPAALGIGAPARLFKIVDNYSSGAGVGVILRAGRLRNAAAGQGWIMPNYAFNGAPVRGGTDDWTNARVTRSADSTWRTPAMTFDAGVIDASLGETDKTYIKVSLEMLLDVRYNPFETGDGNTTWNVVPWSRVLDGERQGCVRTATTKEVWKCFDEKTFRFVYLPVRLLLCDTDGHVLYHYSNNATRTLARNGNGFGYSGRWVQGEPTADWTQNKSDMWLCWYDWTDREKKNGIGGWSTNKQTIPEGYEGTLPLVYQKRGNGEYVPLPPVAGQLRLEVAPWYDAYSPYYDDPDRGFNIDAYPARIEWFAFKNPEVKAVMRDGSDLDDRTTGDMTESAWLEREASDTLDIDLTVGTWREGMAPCARGVYRIKTTDGKIGAVSGPIARAGVADTPEHLLMATAFSQYGERKLKLTGTMSIITVFAPVVHEALPDVVMMPVGRVQHPHDCTEEITAVELGEENYKGMDYEQEDV